MTETPQEPSLKQLVDSGVKLVYEVMGKHSHTMAEMSRLVNIIGQIKEELDTSPNAQSLVSLGHSASSDLSGVTTQLMDIARLLEEMQEVLGSF